ncbi:unnamed protein product [Lampetra fluviatilis]
MIPSGLRASLLLSRVDGKATRAPSRAAAGADGKWLGVLLLLLMALCGGNGASILPYKFAHAGVCPNDLNPNLWVDAQSTCNRECNGDQDCMALEKCCDNVCGLKSCVTARFPEGEPITHDDLASCYSFQCPQQGAECDVWEGKPTCKCKDRCEKEPNFTCASDGLTYYNKCYMDAEACVKGVTLTVVPCKYYTMGPKTSPRPNETAVTPATLNAPTTYVTPIRPALVAKPAQQSVYLGGTVSFHCDVSGQPKPDITWEKQGEGEKNMIMRPDRMYGNMVVTNIGELVIYNVKPPNAGIYTCTARNTAGLLRANFPLSIMRNPHTFSKDMEEFPIEECLKMPDREDCGGKTQTVWYFDMKRNGCFTFSHSQCNNSLNRFITYEECKMACMTNINNTCSLPVQQGPCKYWALRWAYNPLVKRCQSFIYGGCEGNENNFKSQEVCEDNCPFPHGRQCRACKSRNKIARSFCLSDFAILGRMAELTEDGTSGVARIIVDEVLKDEKMGLKVFNTKHLEVTLLHINWVCPCPNVTVSEERLLIMGQVYEGMAVLYPDSFVQAAIERRTKKIYEMISKNACDNLQRVVD